MRNQVFKKLFSVLLALIMVAGLLPASAMAGGWGAMDVDTTPELTETEQPAEPTPGQGEPVAEPTPEQGEPTAEPVPTQGEPTAEPTDEGIMPANVMPVQAETEINNVTKTKSVPLPDGTFYRIVHLDCGRKYFSKAQIKQIIDYAYNYGYTHVELAFGNDGLRFLLEDMSVTVGGTTYENDKVKAAIQQGNIDYSHAGELTEEEMGRIIAYAKGKGIGIIPMFDAPGHLQAVVKAMETLKVDVKYTKPTKSGSSWNYAVDPTDSVSVNFIQALMQKYITYFAGKGCTMFNIAADECGFTGMSTETYTAYAKLVNSMAAMVQNAGMTALAFNDGIYHKNLTTAVEFDTNIAICYWDASEGTYASAAMLAGKGFKIINTHNKWYYVPGNADSAWFGYEWSKGYMNGEAKDCIKTDGGYSGNNVSGCMNAIWLDDPTVSLTADIWKKIENHIALLAQNNPTYFKAGEVKVPAVEITEEDKKVKEVRKSEQSEGTYEVVLHKEPTTAQTLKLTVANGAEGATYTWTSNNTDVATVENGLVTFKGAAGIVTITATPGAATRSINETAAYSITLNVEVEGDVKLEEETITITVGQDATKKQDGKAEITSDYDATVVTISTEVKNVPGSTGKPTKVTTLVSGSKYIISDGNGHYLKRNGTSLINVSSPDQATEWTVTQDTQNTTVWHISDGIYYLSYYNTSWGLYVRTDASKYVSWAYDNNGFKYYDGNNYLKYRNNNWTVTSYSNGSYGAAYEKGEATPGGEQTTITFHGVKEGETTVVVGNVKYTIKVTKEDLSNVAALPVQLWITNNAIEAANSTSENYWAASWSQGTNNGNAFYVNISAGVAYGAEGASIVDLMPNKIMRYEFGGTYFEKARDGKAAKELVVWSGRVHGSSNAQKIYGKDYSNVGTEFKYIRYLGGKWEVSNNRVDWTKVEGTNTLSTEQVVVYYMIRSEITEEITTDVADWGYWNTDTNYSDRINANSYVILDFAVKIDGAERKPASFPQNGKTFVFHCDSGAEAVVGTNTYTRYRQLNNFRAIDNLDENYEVYKVTVTMTKDGSDSSSIIQDTTNYAYEGKEQIIWAIDKDVRNASGLDDYVSITGANSDYNGCKIGGDPYIRGVEVYNQHGALITYYIRAKAVLSNLRVHYRIEGSDKDFYSYGIIAAENTVFGENFGEDRNTETWLKDNVVTDKDGHIITVTAKLEKVDGMGAQYKYGNYTFKRTAREDKDVYLYYTFDANVTFVVDFGLPLKIMPKDVAPNLAIANIQSVTASSQMSRYADVTIGDNYSIIYTLKSMISDADLVSVTYEGTNLTTGLHDSAAFNIHIIPATNVYYEDSFAKFYDKSGNEQTSCSPSTANDEVGIWYIDGQEKTANQALEALGTKENVYGYDPAYNNCTKFSMGSARKVTVTSDMATTGVVWPTAQFTFKGTGFDIISLTDNTSGAIFVDVYKGNSNSGEREKGHVVNNYYGYTYSEEKGWEINNNPNAIYQVPVIKVSGLTYGEHTVVIKVCYDKIFDVADGKKYSFWLDAVRVYDPAGSDLDKDYVKDREVKPIYVEVRKALIEKNSFTADTTVLANGAVFIDGKSTGASIDDYKNFGPNHEVYLASSQAIAFRIVADKRPATVQIGVKLANGSTGTLKISGGSDSTPKFAKYNGSNSEVAESDTLTLSTATDMYYALNDITWTEKKGSQESNVIVLTNTGENSIVSITNVKCTYANAEESTTNTVALAISYDDALMAVDAVNNAITPVEPEPEPEPEPEKTFEPERFEASWSRNVMQGRKATLTVKTSEDVEAITVDGQTIRSYRTRTERVGFGRRAKRITYREFTYSMVAQESADFSVTAINAEGTESEAITARLTVKTRPNSMRDMWDWFKGWF